MITPATHAYRPATPQAQNSRQTYAFRLHPTAAFGKFGLVPWCIWASGSWHARQQERRPAGKRWRADHAGRCHRHLYDHLLCHLDVGMPDMIFNDFDGWPLESVHRGVMDSQNGILQVLVQLKVVNYDPVFACLLAVDTQAVGLVYLVVGEVVRSILRLLCLVQASEKHVLR